MHALSRHPVRRHRSHRVARPALAGAAPHVLALADPAAADPALTGRKAATLASASLLGFPVLPGFVITTSACAAIVSGGGAAAVADVRASLEEAWHALADGGRRTLVVRSSSPGEDGATSSMAGQFTSVLGVRGLAAFFTAVDRVIASARELADDATADDEAPAMAVLVQPQVFPRWGGVLFGVDPVSGRADRLALAAVEGGPDQLVSGSVAGSGATLSRHGRLLAMDGAAVRLPARHRRSLARLAARAARSFGGPQDIEWAVDYELGLLLLQSRPVTAVGSAATARGPVLGPGPVAETFPDPLSTLEAELWLAPLAAALGQAVELTGAASRRRVASSPVVTAVRGRAAADLELLGIASGHRSLWARIDPRPAALRLRAAWRTGRLRTAMPALASDLVASADEELASVPPPASLSDRELLAVLRGSHQALVSLNAHEILAGMLSRIPEGGAAGATSAGAALHVVAAARASGLDDTEMVARHPLVLSLVAPAIGSTTALPDVLVLPALADARPVDPLGTWREALRLRVRWVQELTAVVAVELGTRLARRELLPDAEAIRWLGLDQVEAAIVHGVVPDDLEARRSPAPEPPLPAAFRLAAGELVVPVAVGGPEGGHGAGGGRALGRVVHAGAGTPERGAVLVTRTLDPGLAPVLPRLGGLVSETGSVLSHLAILARELGLPTVVGVSDALERFPAGSVVVVDGTTGEVSAVETSGGGAA